MNIVLLQQEREEKKSEIRITIEQRAAFLPLSLSFLLPKCIQRAIDFSTEDWGLEIAFASSFIPTIWKHKCDKTSRVLTLWHVFVLGWR